MCIDVWVLYETSLIYVQSIWNDSQMNNHILLHYVLWIYSGFTLDTLDTLDTALETRNRILNGQSLCRPRIEKYIQ